MRAFAALVCAVMLASCAARAPMRPTGAQTPDPTAVEAFQQATKPCAGVRTITAELRLSGRAGDEKLGGTLIAGLAAPASVRFVAVAPFGQPLFILAGTNNRATLLLPRDRNVLPDAAVSELLERLIGVALTAHDLRLILTGCLAEPATPTEGRSWPGGWRAVNIGDGIAAYIRGDNARPLVVAADHGQWRVDYANHQNGWPRRVRIRSASDARVDMTAAIEQLEINTDIDDQAFAVSVPAGTVPITLDDLRSVAPLRSSNQ